MRPIVAALLLAGFMLAPDAHPACGVHSDFLTRSDPTLAPVRPPDCAMVAQSPPEFTWPPQNGMNTYALVLTFPDGHAETRSTPRNWLLWDRALPAGRYSWQMKVSGDNRDTSDKRTFTIEADAVPFVVPPVADIVKRVHEAPHPRTWSKGAADPIPALRAERSRGFAELVREVDDHLRDAPEAEPKASSKNANYEDTVNEQKRTLAAAFAWAGTKQRKYGAEAERRMMAQAQWSATGPISHARNDMANRNVAWTLALAYDWTHDYLGEAQKRAILAAIEERTRPMFDDILPRLSTYPYDSHGNLTLNIVAAIGALTAGDIPEADRWVKEALPAAIAWTSPWGWRDGGFANGTAQGFWDTGSNLIAWYAFRGAAGIDLAKKEWVRNHARFMAYFVPPGSPSGAFGDGLEMKLDELWARVSKAYAQFAPSPLASWYARSQSGEDNARLELLLAPRVDPGRGAFPAQTPNAALFPSIGWVAMHSDLADPDRASLYFKASAYGSYNHGHADQLSFVVNHKGRRLAIASGYYDDYASKHWNDWYKQTRAANAITFDGGKGQGINDRKFDGEIASFETHGAYDFAVGGAEKAYDGALARAERAIVYLRPGTVVVYDNVASKTPRAWEWNIHALNRMDKLAERRIAIRNGPALMCIELVAGPEVTFSQTDQFSSPPANAKLANQWHGAFATTARSPNAEFIAVMRIGSDCADKAAKSQAAATRLAGGWKVEVDGKTVTFQDERASVN